MGYVISGQVAVIADKKLQMIDWYMVGSQGSSSGFPLRSFITIRVATGLDSSIFNVARIVQR
jgi:hypothetical protein